MEKKDNKNNIVLTHETKKMGISNNFDSFYVFIKCLFVVIIFLGIFYLLTILITKDNTQGENEPVTSNNSLNDNDTSIDYDKILINESFKMVEGEYLVLYYDINDEDTASIYSGLISTYSSSETTKIYYADISSSLNKKYTGDVSNISPSSLEDLVINGPTLIKFNNGVVEEYIEGKDAITEYLE